MQYMVSNHGSWPARGKLALISACRLTRETWEKEGLLSLFWCGCQKLLLHFTPPETMEKGKNTSQIFSWWVHQESLSLSHCHHSHPELWFLITFHMAWERPGQFLSFPHNKKEQNFAVYGHNNLIKASPWLPEVLINQLVNHNNLPPPLHFMERSCGQEI